jgi:transketolase
MQRSFIKPDLSMADCRHLQCLAQHARADVLRMIATAGSGHPGGSLSSVDILLTLYAGANVDPAHPRKPDRDRIIISHGHIAAGLYAVLGQTGFISPDDAIASFRRCGSHFEGHPSINVPGVDWASGNLGQGLAVGCGMALAARYTSRSYRVYVVLGDGEHQKGQLAEAQRFAAKYQISNLIAIVDCNHLQATGAVADIMPQDLTAEYTVHGWRVLTVDGHDFSQLFTALHEAQQAQKPTVILAQTVMGKGVSFIENDYLYHGTVLSEAECAKALAELQSISIASAAETAARTDDSAVDVAVESLMNPGKPITYAVGEKVACRTAFGNALADIAKLNIPHVPLVVLDCDLGPSVKVDSFARIAPDHFIECGIQEHHAASLAGGLSAAGALPVFADFGVFALCETYNQQRFNDINHTSVKLVATHCGLDVGEDGKTHQSIDYIGLLANQFGWKLVIPADANQTDRALRWMLTTPGNIAMAMGRSPLPIAVDDQGQTCFGDDYTFTYGKADWIRAGHDVHATIISYGALLPKAVAAADRLATLGWQVGVLNISCPFALDQEALCIAKRSETVMVYEDHHIRTGLGTLIAAYFTRAGFTCRFHQLGISRYGGSGKPDDLYRAQCLDVDSLVQQVLNWLEN